MQEIARARKAGPLTVSALTSMHPELFRATQHMQHAANHTFFLGVAAAVVATAFLLLLLGMKLLCAVRIAAETPTRIGDRRAGTEPDLGGDSTETPANS